MALLAVVLFFLLLAALALFLAFSGGPAGARRRVESRRGGKTTAVLFLGALVVLGIAIPAAVIASEKNNDSIPEAGIRDLTELQKHGQELFGQRCKQCHTLAAANANGKIGPNLDELQPEKGLVLDAIKNGRARGNGQMPAAIVEGEDAEAVAQFVAVAVGNDPNPQ
jgi:mono/diheme cytochrome c family protein